MNKKKEDFFSKDYTGLLIDSVGGYISPERVELFLKKLQKEASKYIFDSGTEANLIRVTDSLFDKVSFVNEAIYYPHHLEILTAIVSSSNFLTDIIVQNPGLLYQIFDNEYLTRIDTADSLKLEIETGIAPFRSFNSRLNYLKQFKKRYILKTGINDILGFSTLENTTSALSTLAGALLTALFEICLTEIEAKYKISLARSYCLASLGKQGGNELNYSSDVDLILFYEKDFIPDGTLNREYFELINEAAQLFIKSSSEMTEKGYLYRVDFRLRPDGGHSPLCRTITDYMRYYEARGENWERQMLIKLNFVCGSNELFNSFYNYISGFIFPASYSSSIGEQVKKIKNEIERKIAGAENVKLFRGGIRDIEFSVQVLQLLNGGKSRELRNGNTLESITLLRKKGLLSPAEADTFNEAYIFYRKTEHFLQLMNDRQTHLIPEDTEFLAKLARYLKLKDGIDFGKTIGRYRNKVRKIYKRILMPEKEEENDYLQVINFRDKARAAKNIKYLQSGTGILGTKEFEAKTIDDFNSFEPGLLKYLAASDDPDKVLENFTKVIKNVSSPSLWYNQLRNKIFLKSFLTLCGHSQISIDLISSGKQTGDIYLSGECFRLPAKEFYGQANFNGFMLTLSTLYTLNRLKEKDFSRAVSDAIDEKIIKNTANFGSDYFIAAMGSYGSREMNLASDIDFLFVLDDSADIYQSEKDYENLIKKLNKEIELFGIDLRLRPEGKNSQLARTISSYNKYLIDRARIWEFQSLIKLRFVSGNKKLFNKFCRKVISRVETIEKQSLRKEIIEMHNSFTRQSSLLNEDIPDIKKSKGGLTTIEFAAHYLILSNRDIFKKCMGKPLSRCLNILKDNQIFPDDINSLLINYQWMKKQLFLNQNYTGAKNYKLPVNTESGRKLKEIFKQNINIFNKIMEK